MFHLKQAENPCPLDIYKDPAVLALLAQTQEQNQTQSAVQEQTEAAAQEPTEDVAEEPAEAVNEEQAHVVAEEETEDVTEEETQVVTHEQTPAAVQEQTLTRPTKKRARAATQETTQGPKKPRTTQASKPRNRKQKRDTSYETSAAGPSGSSSRDGSQTPTLGTQCWPIPPRLHSQDGAGVQHVMGENGRYIGGHSRVPAPTAPEQPVRYIVYSPHADPTPGSSSAPRSAHARAPPGLQYAAPMTAPQFHPAHLDRARLIPSNAPGHPAIAAPAAPAAVPTQLARVPMHRSQSAPSPHWNGNNGYAVNVAGYEAAPRPQPPPPRYNLGMYPPTEVARMVPIETRYDAQGTQIVGYGQQQPPMMAPQRFINVPYPQQNVAHAPGTIMDPRGSTSMASQSVQEPALPPNSEPSTPTTLYHSPEEFEFADPAHTLTGPQAGPSSAPAGDEGPDTQEAENGDLEVGRAFQSLFDSFDETNPPAGEAEEGLDAFLRGFL